VHVATAEALKFSYEVLLRSVIKHLSDAVTSEFLFIVDFFKTNSQETFNKYLPPSLPPLSCLTLSLSVSLIDFLSLSPSLCLSPRSIFKKTLSLVLENLENYLLTTYDTIGILLIIKV
jgi:hypothetical protein